MPTIRCKEKIRNRLFMKKLWKRGKEELMKNKRKKEKKKNELSDDEKFRIQNKILEWFERNPQM